MSCCVSGADCAAEGAADADAGLWCNLLSVAASAFPVRVAVQATAAGLEWNLRLQRSCTLVVALKSVPLHSKCCACASESRASMSKLIM